MSNSHWSGPDGRTKGGIIESEPIYVCFEEHRLPLRLVNHRDALVVFLEGLSGGIDAFLTECGRRWLLRRNTSIDQRQQGQADDAIRPSCDFVEFLS